MLSPLIALDWGTSRARAFLIDETGAVIDRRSTGLGIQSVPRGGFPDAFETIAGEFQRARPDAAIVLAGMVGSRNGWIEAAYAPCPASAQDIAAAAATVQLAPGVEAVILPGLSCNEGAFDVMRGEETLIVGLGLDEGLVCLPGTHSKWASIEGGRIARFASFMTGEIYGLLREHSILARLAGEGSAPEATEGTRLGLLAARRPGGILNAAFAARTEVLAGRMAAGMVGPYLSALLVAHEIAGAQAMFGPAAAVTLVADSALAESYGQALANAGLSARLVTPEAAFVAGVSRLAGALS